MIISIPKRGPVHVKLDSQDEFTFTTLVNTDLPYDERFLTVKPAGFKSSWALSKRFDASFAEDDEDEGAIYAASIDNALVHRAEAEILKAFHAGTLA